MAQATRLAACTSALLATLLLSGCTDSRLDAPAATEAALASITVTPVRIPLERRLDGIIEAVNQSTIAAQTAGRVAAILYDIDDFVAKDAVIVRLRAVERSAALLQAKAALNEAAAHADEAQSRYRRIEDLYQERIVTKATFEQAVAARDAALARLAGARATLHSATEGLAYTEIRAPYAGVLTGRHVEPGETVAPGTALVSSMSLQQLRAVVEIPQSIIEQVRRIGKATVQIDERRVAVSRITIFPGASAPSNTFAARLDLPEDSPGLHPGMFVKVAFIIGEAERLLIPSTALIERGELSAVYVLDADDRISLRQIRPGRHFDAGIEVLAGLGAGERIALQPQAARYRLESAAATSRGTVDTVPAPAASNFHEAAGAPLEVRNSVR